MSLDKPSQIVRTRFAPSPTGLIHIGGVRTALFNYLFAKSHQGSFILRIEDTDIERSKPEYEKDFLENLKWLGIIYDEGPDVAGDYGPYRQSERLAIYEKYIKKLLDEGLAYYCFCSEEELESQRQYQLSRGEAPKYSGKCQNLTKKEIEKNLKDGKNAVIRFKVPVKKVKFKDLIRGGLEFDMGLIGDIIIAKNPRYPLFVLAGVIDDFEMKISHVIRGEEHLSNTPKQILLQEAMGFPKPEYVHLPMILGQDKSKLSKRHGATAISDYRIQGYLPETLLNFMAFLGWNPGDEREIFSMRSLIKEFSLERCQKGGAIFNIKRLDFLNGFYIRNLSLEKLAEKCLPYFIEQKIISPLEILELKNNNHTKLKLKPQIKTRKFKITATGDVVDLDWFKKIIKIEQERLKKLSEITELTDFFFKEKLEYPKELLKWKEIQNSEIKESLEKSEKLLSDIKEGDWTKENLEKILMPEAEKIGLPADLSAEAQGAKVEASAKANDRGKLLWPLRVALTGKQASAGPFEVAEILGKQKTLTRIKKAQKLLS